MSERAEALALTLLVSAVAGARALEEALPIYNRVWDALEAGEAFENLLPPARELGALALPAAVLTPRAPLLEPCALDELPELLVELCEALLVLGIADPERERAELRLILPTPERLAQLRSRSALAFELASLPQEELGDVLEREAGKLGALFER